MIRRELYDSRRTPLNQVSELTRKALVSVQHVTITTKDEDFHNWKLQIIKNAVFGGGGTFSGGTQIGVDLNKGAGSLDITFLNLTGFDFAGGDRLAAFAAGGTGSFDSAKAPVVRLYVKYD